MGFVEKTVGAYTNTGKMEKNVERLKHHTRTKVSKASISIFRTAFIICMAYVLLYPILILVSRAVKPAKDMVNPSIIWIPSGITFQNITDALRILDYGNTLFYTVRIVLVSTLLTIIACSMAGYALARYNLKLSKLCMAIAIFTIVVPMQTYIIPLYFQFRFFDFFGIGSLMDLLGASKLFISINDTEWVYYLPAILGVGLRSGLFVVVFMQFFKGMPKELESAARIDGCGEFRTFLQVMVPNAGPVFLVVFLFSTVWYWNDYFFSQIMIRGQLMLSTKIGILRQLVNLSVNVGSYGDGFTETGIIFAGALLFILPPLIMYMFIQKYFIQSIERAGIVG